MPLRLDIRRSLTVRSDRVKSVDLHPTEPWMLMSLYSGNVVVWNHETQIMVKTFELCDLPVRTAKFVARKHWVVGGADDLQIHALNYNTMARVCMFEAHSDYIRCLAVHPTQPYILSSSDDMLIKLWNWEKKWTCTQVFEGHNHYIMQISFNPKDNNQFASASLDRTVKVWQLGSNTSNFTLEGHTKGVNCVDYYNGGDSKPYLISGSDDHCVKIWDYQNKTCVQTLEGHVQNVSCVAFHPELPIILTGSEDGTVRMWHANTYRLENTLNYSMDRVWCLCVQPGSNSVALGFDEGCIIIKLGRDEPAMSMDSSGKVIWARHCEMQQVNLKAMGETEIQDGERLLLGIKEMGSCEVYPQTIQYSPNGRFVAVCGDGEYIIYTAMALRSKSFGPAQEFVWANDSSGYAIRDSNNMIKIFKNFKGEKQFKPEFGTEGIYGGLMLGVRSKHGLAFYDWDNTELIRRIEIQPKHIFWSDSGELVCIATDESFFVLRYRADKVAEAQESSENKSQDGIEDAFEVLGEVQHVVKTGFWVGDCFIYTNSVNRLNYYVGGEIITISHMDRTMYLLGYIPKDNRLYLADKELNIVSFSLLVSVLEYQTAVMRRDFSLADKVLPIIPKEQRTRVAHFLEKQGFSKQALAVSTDPEHRFELAVQLGDLEVAHQMALEAQSEYKWKELAELATAKSQFSLAQECLHQTQDYGGLLLLATASGNASMLDKLAEEAERNSKANVTFLSYFLQGKLEKCLDVLIKTDRLPEAAFLARTHLPSQVSRVVKLWKESLLKVNQKSAYALADPSHYSNLFPGLQEAIAAEQYLKETRVRVKPAAEYPLIMPNEERNILDECAGFGPKEERIEAEMELENTDEPSGVAAVTHTAPAEEAEVEESDSKDSKSEEEAISTSASLLPVTLTEECVEEQQAKSSSTDGTPIEQEMETLNETAAESEEESEIFPKELEKEQSRPTEDVRSSAELNVQIMSPAADAEHTVCVSESLSSRTEATKRTPTEASSEAVPEGTATENLLFTLDTDVIPSDTAATEDTIISEELDADFVSSEVEAIIHSAAAADETPVSKGITSESEPSAAAADERATFENTRVSMQDHDSAELAKNLALDTIIAQEPLPSQDPEHGKETTTLQEKPEENLQPAEAEVLLPAAEPSEEQAGPEGEPAGREAEINQVFSDLDLDSFDLEDIDTTEFNLDEDFLNE